MITLRSVIVGIIGFCLYLIALVNELPSFYFVLTWLAVSILVSSLGLALLSLVGLDCRWHVARASVSEAIHHASSQDEPGTGGASAAESDGSTAHLNPSAAGAVDSALQGPLLDFQFANSGTLNKTGVLVEINLESTRGGSAFSRRFMIEALPSGASIAATLALNHLPRGRYRVGGIRLIGSDVLGLFRVQQRLAAPYGASVASDSDGSTRIAEPPELVVGPLMVVLPEMHALLAAGAASGSLDATRLLGQSEELRGTRPYVAGDDLRQVHWKSTARHGQLVVKEFYRTAQIDCLVVWDGAAQTTWGQEGDTTVDYGLRVVASLCRTLTEGGRPCGLLRLDSHPLAILTGHSGGASQLTLAQVSNALADADALRRTSLSQAMLACPGRLMPGTDLFLITASLAPDVVPAVTEWRARGAQVTVGLIDGGAFLDPPDGSSRHRLVEPARPPRQRWECQADGETLAGEAPVTPESYRNQVQLLRQQNVPAVLLAPPAADEPHEAGSRASTRSPHSSYSPYSPYRRDLVSPVRDAVRDLLTVRLAQVRPRQPTVTQDSTTVAQDAATVLAG